MRASPTVRSSLNNNTIQSAGRPIFLAGPTGVGKSALAIALAESMNAEIVGADAFQIYREIPILTAQPTADVSGRVPHHLVGCISVRETYDVARYIAAARVCLAEIAGRGKTPLVVGGTGLYIRALADGLAPTPPPNAQLRAELECRPLGTLINRLKRADPTAARYVDLANKRRVIRAIEICEISGQPLAAFRAQRRTDAPGVVVVRAAEDLHRRIAANVRAMFEIGVVEEVAAVGNPGLTASKAIGFRLIQCLIRGEIDRATCVERITAATRQYAKRQLTWFRNQSSFYMLDLSTLPPEKANAAIRALANARE